MMSDPIRARTNLSKRDSIEHRFKKTPDHLLEIATAIQKRDREICIHLFEHKVLTTHQIQELFFDNERVCRRRLARLRELGLVKPFRPRAPRGSLPNHYVLGDLGLYLVAAEFGVEVKDLGLKKDRITRIAFSSKLNHHLAVNSFFSRLVWATRHTQAVELVLWRSERRLANRRPPLFTVPDGEGHLLCGSIVVRFFLEMDMGTENFRRLNVKLRWHQEHRLDSDLSGHWVLFCFLDSQREIAARKAMEPYLRVATATLDRHVADPLDRNWRPLDSYDRDSLPDLPETLRQTDQ